MNVTYNWLKEFVDFDATPEELAALLTMLGLEVESMEKLGEGLDDVVVALVEEKLQAAGAKSPELRKAQFKCTLCVMSPDGETRYFEGVAPGQLVWPPRGALGHGYDPMFVPDGQTQTFAEMDHDTKNAISHRGLALEKLLRELF